MEKQSSRQLKNKARQILTQTPGHRKAVLMVFGISAAVSLLTSVLNFLLDGRIAETGGLGGLGLRGVLATVQSVLSTGVALAMPFLSMGYCAAMLRVTRQKKVNYRDLTQGFRRFGAVAAYLALQLLLYFVLALVCSQVASVLFSLSPFSAGYYAIMAQAGTDMAALEALLADPVSQEALMEAMIPMMILFAVLYIALMVPVSFRLRMAGLCLMDDHRPRGMAAMGQSSRMMKGNCLRLFRLDLSFWWFYLAEVGCSLLCYGDMILLLLGVSLPINADLAFFLAYGLGLAAQVLLYWFARNDLEVTYALFYESVRPRHQEVQLPRQEA